MKTKPSQLTSSYTQHGDSVGTIYYMRWFVIKIFSKLDFTCGWVYSDPVCWIFSFHVSVEIIQRWTIKDLGMGAAQKVQSGSDMGTGDRAALLGTVLFSPICSPSKSWALDTHEKLIQAWGQEVHPWVCNSAVHHLYRPWWWLINTLAEKLWFKTQAHTCRRICVTPFLSDW